MSDTSGRKQVGWYTDSEETQGSSTSPCSREVIRTVGGPLPVCQLFFRLFASLPSLSKHDESQTEQMDFQSLPKRLVDWNSTFDLLFGRDVSAVPSRKSASLWFVSLELHPSLVHPRSLSFPTHRPLRDPWTPTHPSTPTSQTDTNRGIPKP